MLAALVTGCGFFALVETRDDAAVVGNTLYVAALRGERLWALPLDGFGRLGRPRPLLENRYGRLRAVAQAPDGTLWISTSHRDRRGQVRAGDDRILRLTAPQSRVGAAEPGAPTASSDVSSALYGDPFALHGEHPLDATPRRSALCSPGRTA